MPVVQHHWQSVESAAFRSWPFKIPSGDLDGIARKTFPSSHLEPVRVPTKGSWSRFCRTRRPSRVFSRARRIRRAGCSRDRQPAGDKRIYHQLLGSGRRCSTIEEVSTAAWPGYPCEGLGDLGCSEAPASGLSSPWEAFSRRAAMPRQSLLKLILCITPPPGLPKLCHQK